jgi:SAM-dependent methyltransferase
MSPEDSFMSKESNGYWRSAAEDESMQGAHEFVWKATLQTIEVDLRGRRVLDVDCNRGGFLRMLCDQGEIAEGFGYDPAESAVEDARRLAGERPLFFEVADTVPENSGEFEVVFSHGVVYLIHDLVGHARAMYRALAAGGSYYASIGVHADSPLLAAWHHDHVDDLRLPRLYSVDEVVSAFSDVGFDCAAARLQMGFVPAVLPDLGLVARLVEWLDYNYERKLLLRFTRPTDHSHGKH